MTDNNKQRALLMDLDGTIIETISGKTFPVDAADWQFIPGIIDRIRSYFEQGYLLLIVSNQGGIGTHCSLEDMHSKFQEIVRQLSVALTGQEQSDRIDYLFCASMDKLHSDRKPNCGMAQTFEKKYNLDLSRCIMVGDASRLPGNFSDSDKLFARNAGIGQYLDVAEFLQQVTS